MTLENFNNFTFISPHYLLCSTTTTENIYIQFRQYFKLVTSMLLFACFLWRCGPNAGHALLIYWGFLITHSDTSQSVGLLWTSDQLVTERPLLNNTQYSQQTDIHAPGGIRTHDLSRRAAADLRLRPRGYWDRQRPCVSK